MDMLRFSKRDFEITKKVLKGRTLQNVANEYGISRERVRQITFKVKRSTAQKYKVDLDHIATRNLRDHKAEQFLLLVEGFQKTRMDALL